MAGVASTNETEREGKESNKYFLNTHHIPLAVLKNEPPASSQSSLSGKEKQVLHVLPGNKCRGQWAQEADGADTSLGCGRFSTGNFVGIGRPRRGEQVKRSWDILVKGVKCAEALRREKPGTWELQEAHYVVKSVRNALDKSNGNRQAWVESRNSKN